MKITLGGVEKDLRPLTIEESEAWKARTGETAMALLSSEVGLDLELQVQRWLVDTLVSYDVDSTAGSAEWIRKHATAGEVWDAAKVVASAEFAWLEDVRSTFGDESRSLVLSGLLSAMRRPEAPAPATAPEAPASE